MDRNTASGEERETSGRDGPSSPTAAFETAERDLLERVGLDVRTRVVDLASPPLRTRVLEAGPPADDGPPPLLFVHGTAEFAGFLAPLATELDGRPSIAFDRPGFGLAGEFVYTAGNLRRTVVDAVRSVLDALGLERVDLVGHSMGGYSSLLFALAHPERVRRLVLVGGVPAFPGTRPPLPLRLMQVPLLDRLLARVQKPGEEGVLDFAAVFGERESIQRYPALVRAIAAQQEDPARALAGESEFGSLVSLRGWREPIRLREATLRSIQQPTLVLWGVDDPLGSPHDVRDGVGALPHGRFEPVPGAHAPFFAHPEHCARLVRAFVGDETSAAE